MFLVDGQVTSATDLPGSNEASRVVRGKGECARRRYSPILARLLPGDGDLLDLDGHRHQICQTDRLDYLLRFITNLIIYYR
ncbi:hypothetical protein [Chamaesiphon sp.]|uniref:hypothetical protein n=1 Tax=Chamaesiphon sp. TaxID=2814140 RepID=UPI003593ADEC